MTTLQIIPKLKDKTAKFKGTIAAGEHVAVTIANGGADGVSFVTDVSKLRLRVVGLCGETLAMFPFTDTNDSWSGSDGVLSCELNLNTVQMLRAVPPAATVPLLFVLDDEERKTLYFKDFCEVTHWPQLVGEDTPVDLGKYKDLMKYVDAWHKEHVRGMAIIEALDATVVSGAWAFWPQSQGGDDLWHRLLISKDEESGYGCLSYESEGREYRSLVDRFEALGGVLYVGRVFRRRVADGVLYLGAVA